MVAHQLIELPLLLLLLLRCRCAFARNGRKGQRFARAARHKEDEQPQFGKGSAHQCKHTLEEFVSSLGCAMSKFLNGGFVYHAKHDVHDEVCKLWESFLF